MTDNTRTKTHLSLVIGEDRVTYVHLFPEDECFSGIQEVDLDTRDPEALEKELTHRFGQQTDDLSVTAAFATPLHTLIPKGLFHEKDLHSYFQVNFGIDPGADISYDPLPSQQCYNVFYFPTSLSSVLKSHFPTIRVFNDSTILLEALSRQQKLSKETEIHANFRREAMDLTIFQGGKLLLHNDFIANTAEDATYFILHAREQLEVPAESVNLKYSGNPFSEETKSLVTEYMAKVEENPMLQEYDSWNLAKVPDPQSHFTLLSQYLCV